MPPPASYIDITSVPFSRVVTVAEFNVANEIWFRFITGSKVAYGNWTSRPAGVALISSIFESDGSTLIKSLGSSTAWWRHLNAGTYYIKVARSPAAPIAADFTYEADTRPLDAIGFVTESVLISDDSNAQIPAIILKPDGTIPTFVSAIPTGEIGDALPNGYVLVHDRFGKYGTANSLILFNPSLAMIANIIPSTPFTQFPRITHSNTDFYVIDSVEGHLYKVTTAGVITFIATIAEILADGVNCAGITTDGTIIYFAIGTDATGQILKYVIATGVTTVHHTIAGFTPVTDKIALTFDSNPGDLIVLPDGSYVTWWVDNPGDVTKIIHISSAGALLNTFTFTPPADRVNHLSYASTTLSTHIKVWDFQGATIGASKIGNLNLSTGVFDTSFTIDTFFTASNANTNDNDKFGPSSSCPMYTLFVASNLPGLFKLPPGKRTDHNGTIDVAIPNPTFRTALLP